MRQDDEKLPGPKSGRNAPALRAARPYLSGRTCYRIPASNVFPESELSDAGRSGTIPARMSVDTRHMKTLYRGASLFLLSCLCLSVPAPGSEDSLVIATYSTVHNGYARQKGPDGSFRREYYALAQGRYMPGLKRDRSIDDVKFPPLAGLVAQYLARENYYMAQDSKSAELLLIITWGTTIPFGDSVYRANLSTFLASMNHAVAATHAAAGTPMSVEGIQSPQSSVAAAARSAFEQDLYQMLMFEGMRDRADEYNAGLLGYGDEMNRYRHGSWSPSMFAGAGTAYYDMKDDIENERYFVVIAAYDFKAALKEGKRKLLWVTRVSVQAQGNQFDRDVSAMLAKASHHFGRSSGRLLRQYYEGVVTVGDLKVLGYEPGPAPAPAKPEDRK